MGLFDGITEDIKDAISEKISDVKDSLFEKAGDIIDDVGDTVTEVADKVTGGRISRTFNTPSVPDINDINEDGLSFSLSRDPIKESEPSTSEVSTSHTSKTKQQVQLSSVQKLKKDLERLDNQEEKQINNLLENGGNVFASLADTFLNRDKFKKAHEISRKITGKNKDEKIEEVKQQFDIKRAKVFKKVILPLKPKELWELLNLVHSLVLKDYEAQSSDAVVKLYTEILDQASRIFPSNEEYNHLFKNYTPIDK
ncbi:MAG: hypothetical protein J1F38_07015 [Muribaculaceae bacterium]|nr:hypothetical protein [Muribaculaceae bacterium]